MRDEEKRSREIRILEFWKEGEVWFRDHIPDAVPWGTESLLREVPESARGHYGAVVGSHAKVDGQSYEPGSIVIVESREQLRQLTTGIGKIDGLIFPWYERVVPPNLWMPYRKEIDLQENRARIQPALLKAFLITCAGVAACYYFPEFLFIALLAATFYGLYPLVQYGTEWLRRVDKLSVADLNGRLVSADLFGKWLTGKSTTGLKVALGVLVLVFVGQVLVDGNQRFASIEAAALVKTEVKQNGEWWRIVTAGVMHGSIPHILFNGMALFSLGRVLIALVSPALLSSVFLVSVISGSLASLYLSQAEASVGASGGILGCLGFLLVVNHKFRHVIPRYLNASLIQSTIVIALFGLLGAGFIDNAAHAGGFIGGIALGLICWPWLRLAPTKTRSVGLAFGLFSTAVITAAVVKVGMELWKIGF
jgi:membrane associated rhomboid family serine protease